MKTLKTILGIACPVATIIYLVIAVSNALIDRKTKVKQSKAWDNPDRIYQNVGIGMEFQKERSSIAESN